MLPSVNDIAFVDDDCNMQQVNMTDNQQVYLTSSNYPKAYDPNQDCSWIFNSQSPGTYKIRLLRLDLEYYDILAVGTGSEVTKDSVVSQLNLWDYPEKILIEDLNMWVTFYSNEAVARGGFIIVISRMGSKGKYQMSKYPLKILDYFVN